MKVVLNIKNLNMNDPLTNNSVILYDASDKKWYITDKSDLIYEINLKVEKSIKELEEKTQELETKWKNFMFNYTEQNSKLIPILETIMNKETK